MQEDVLHSHVEKLASIHEGRPEWRDEQENKENCCILASPVRTAEIRRLKSSFADEASEYASETYEEEGPATESFHEERAEDVAWER